MTNKQKFRTRYGTVTVTFTALGLLSSIPAAFAQSTIYVEQVGAPGSTSALSNSATAIYLDEFTFATNGTPTAAATPGYTTSASLTTVTPINLSAQGTTLGSTTITDSGVATSEGFLTFSGNTALGAQSSTGNSGNYLTFAGYDAAVNTANIAKTTNPDTSRGVGIIALGTGVIDTSTELTDAYSANNIRSATTTDGKTVYTAGVEATGGSGVRSIAVDANNSTSKTTPSTSQETASINTRVVEQYGTSTYFSTGSTNTTGGTTPGIYMLGATAGAAPIQIAATTGLGTTATTGGTSPYAFAFYTPTGGTVTDLYIADSSSGIEKFTEASGQSTFKYDYLYSSTTAGLSVSNVSGLSVDLATGDIYVVTPTSLDLLTDSDQKDASSGSFSFSNLATAGSNNSFRSVQVVDAAPFATGGASAAPEPSEWAAMAFTGLGMGGLLLRARRRKQGTCADA